MRNYFYELQKWYQSQCDDDWEHTYGVKIDTLDNPGWIVRVDLSDTIMEDLVVPISRIDRSEDDWIQHEVKNNQFVGCGGPFNLEEIIKNFLELCESVSGSDPGSR